RKYRSSRTSMLDGWISSGSYGSSLTRPDSISALMSRSERSTLATYRVRYDIEANTAQAGPAVRAGVVQGRTSASQADSAGSIPVTRSNVKAQVRGTVPEPGPCCFTLGAAFRAISVQ